jgi:hypothetical protein
MSTTAIDPDNAPVGDDELTRLAIAWEGFIDAIRRGRGRYGDRLEDGLTLSQYEFVRPLIESEGLPVGQLADLAGIRAATAWSVPGSSSGRGPRRTDGRSPSP